MENTNLENLNRLAKLFGTDRLISPEDIQEIRSILIGVLANNKKEVESLTEETRQAVESFLNKVETEHDKYLDETKQIAQELKSDTTEAINFTLKSLEEVKALCKEVMDSKPENGEDADEEYVIGEVLNRIKLPEYKEIVLDDGGAIVDKINSLPVNEENQIDAKHIKNLPEGKGGKVISGGVTRKIVEQMIEAAGAGGTPGGSTTQLQYNNAGAFGGISGATTDGTAVTYTANNLKAADITASGSGGFLIQSNSGTDVGLFGAGGGAGATFYGGVNIGGSLTVDTNTLYVDATNNVVGIGTASPLTQTGNVLQVGSTAAVNQYLVFQTNNGAERGIQYYLLDGTTLRGYMKWDTEEDLLLKGDTLKISTQNVTNPFHFGDGGGIGLFGIGTTAPTHSLTLNSTSTGIALYNTADQTTNYERGEFLWSGNEYVLRTLNGGTGTSRPIKVAARNSSGNQTSLTLTRVSAPFSLLTHDSTGTTGKINQVTGTSASSSSTYNFYCIEPTINQSSTAGYTALLVNPTETTTGSGSKLLADFQVGGVSKFSVDNTGKIVSAVNTIQLSSASIARSGAHALTLSTSGTTNATYPSGTITLVDLAATQTLTNKTITKRVVTTADDATAVIDVAVTDVYQLTAIANNTTFSFTGTPTDGQTFVIRYKDAGVSKTLTWTGFTAIGVTLPAATTAGKWGYVGVTYNSDASAYHATAVATES